MRPLHFWLPTLVTALATALGCEAWAAFVHRVVWHGPLWRLHKSHHAGPKDVAPSGRKPGWFELNDVFGVLHGIVATGLVMHGLRVDAPLEGAVCVGIGAGLTLYGLLYALVHDGLVHGRLRTVTPRRGYWRRVFGAHRAHHRTGKAPYGLFWAPWAIKRVRRTKVAPRL